MKCCTAGARHMKCCYSVGKAYEMLLLREQGIRDVMAMEIWPVGTRYRRFVALGITNNAQDMLLLWEQSTGDAVVVGARHSRCCCCRSKAEEMMLQ
jgi:hypothetical protein